MLVYLYYRKRFCSGKAKFLLCDLAGHLILVSMYYRKKFCSGKAKFSFCNVAGCSVMENSDKKCVAVAKL